MKKYKKILITGGTGSFGSSILKKFIKNKNISEIRVVSRDEKKQFDLRNYFKNEKIKFYIGDVRDVGSIEKSMPGVDCIFHAAALKQVPSCEFHPIEAVKTNVLGTENVINSAIEHKVKKVICLSTDKAVYPINAMGFSKAMMEKVCTSNIHIPNKSKTSICVTRYGNVIASRGSLIPLLLEQIKKNKPMTITDPRMTRFMMTMDEAIELVMYALINGKNGDIFVKKTESTKVLEIAEAIRIIYKKPKHRFKFIGIRHGEKLHETLLTKEERIKSIDFGNYFKICPDERDLNYEKYFNTGSETKNNEFSDYNSTNAQKLKKSRLINILKNIDKNINNF